MKIRDLMAVSGLMATLFAAPLRAQDAEVPVGSDFAGIGYAINTRSDVFVYAGLRDIGGQVGVCGIIWTESATNTAKRLERQASRKIKFSVAGLRLRVTTDKFNRFDSRAEAEAGLAGCSVTNTPWQAGFAGQPLDMGLAAGTLRD
jgi:hypothetical protein